MVKYFSTILKNEKDYRMINQKADKIEKAIELVDDYSKKYSVGNQEEIILIDKLSNIKSKNMNIDNLEKILFDIRNSKKKDKIAQILDGSFRKNCFGRKTYNWHMPRNADII